MSMIMEHEFPEAETQALIRTYRCHYKPQLNCKMDLFLANIETYRKKSDTQLKYKRHQVMDGLMVLNNCKEDWQSFLGTSGTITSGVQFKDLMVSFLDEKSLYYLTFEGIPSEINYRIRLARVHWGGLLQVDLLSRLPFIN
jgi:hypothetical protein